MTARQTPAGAPSTARAHQITRALAVDRGSAPAAVLMWVALALVLLAALTVLGQGARAQARAASAADLAALAAADAVAVGGAAPCGVAREVAQRNGAVLASCTVEGEEVLVRARVPAAPLPDAVAVSRAGPGPIVSGTDSG